MKQANEEREAAEQQAKQFRPADSSELNIANVPDERVGTALMHLAFPVRGVTLMAIAIMVSTFGCLNGLILAGARLYWAMARDGLFFRQTGTLNARGVPAAGLVLQGIWSVLLIFSGTYG